MAEELSAERRRRTQSARTAVAMARWGERAENFRGISTHRPHRTIAYLRSPITGSDIGQRAREP
jgi:hypothetical protein